MEIRFTGIISDEKPFAIVNSDNVVVLLLTTKEYFELSQNVIDIMIPPRIIVREV